MKKTYILKNLDCANCANKLETKINKLKGVNEVSISFLQQKLTIDINDDIFDEIFEEIKKVGKKVERDLEIIQ